VIVVADLKTSRVAAFTADVNGSPIAVVNSLARRDPVVREEAAGALAAAGFDADTIHEVLYGVRS
jgi:hypothetical protein